MKISIFTSNYNNGAYIKQAVESVLNQTYTDFEYFLYDDDSTDDSYDIMKKYEYDKRVKTFKLKKQDNVGVIINKSFAISDGDYWCWCPSDDYFDKELLKTNIDYSYKFPLSVLYNDAILINQNGETIGKRIANKMSAEEFSKIVWEDSPIGFTGIFIPKYVYKTLPFPEHLKYSEDFYWMIKATIHDIPFNGVPEFLSYKRKHSNTLTAKNLPQILANIPKIREELKQYQKKLAI